MATANLDSDEIRRAVADRGTAARDPAWQGTATPGSDAREQALRDVSEIIAEQFAALKVLTLDPEIRAFLQANDPKALEQAETAITRTVDVFGEPAIR